MAFMVSPGVNVREIDLTNVIPAVSTSIGAVAGFFNWGPVKEIVTVNSEKTLVNRFGEPDNNTAPYFMPAAQFLQYANTLRVVRAEIDGMVNANVDGNGILVRNADSYDQVAFGVDGNEFVAKYPGEIGNSIQVFLVTNATSFQDLETLGISGVLDFAPSTSPYAAERGALNDEVHVIVVDEGGNITGTRGSILEVFQGLSQASDAKDLSGSSNYYKDVINSRSRFVWVGNTPVSLPNAGEKTTSTNLLPESDGNSFVTDDQLLVYSLSGGSNGNLNEPSLGELIDAYDMFEDSDTVDVNFLISVGVSEADDVPFANYLADLATIRRDAVAFISPSVSRSINAIDNAVATSNVLNWAEEITSTSYAVMDSGAVYVYDKYNDEFRWIVAAGDVAGLCANTDSVADPWFSPAGLNRGQLRGVSRLAYNPTQTDRDELYKGRVNPLVSFPGEGTILFGDKTALARASAFDRINVRRLFIVLQKAIATAAKFQLFELNDEFTQAQFRNLVEPFLRDVQGRRGITDFLVVCDETNNTPEVVDTNRFVADIYIKPARSINFITLSFIAVRTGVEFDEIAGQS